MSCDSESSGSHSSDAGQKKSTPIPFLMHRDSMDREIGLGTYKLEMPLSEGRSTADECPVIILEIKDEDQMGCLLKMKKLQHKNILGVHFFDKDGDGAVRAFLEQHSGYYISDLFKKADFFVNQGTGLVPSSEFQKIVRESLDGLDCIIKNDLYHGNFSWETTVYQQGEADGKRTLKLCNFENRKNKSPLDCKLGDCYALAHVLEKVSRRVKVEYVDFKPETCVLIDDLACRLRAINNMESLSTMKQDIEDSVFFWDDKRKRSFCAYEMPEVWFRPAFQVSFKSSPSMPSMPWDKLWKAHALKGAMERYRVINHIEPYNFNALNDFLRYISGLYTHQIQLK